MFGKDISISQFRFKNRIKANFCNEIKCNFNIFNEADLISVLFAKLSQVEHAS